MPYNTIPDAEIDPDSPVTASLMQKLRDNPIGIAQAAAGAPKVQYNALNGAGITYAYSAGVGIPINFVPFAHTPTGTVTHLIFVLHIDQQQTGNSSTLTVRVDGADIFSVLAGTSENLTQHVFEMRAHLTTNAPHTFSFVHTTQGAEMRATIVSIAS